ncbi:MAG: M48 family metallopeptidase [Gaiellaceae bacterium]
MTTFTAEEVERARGYHRPLYLTLPVDLALSLAVLCFFSFVWTPAWGPWATATLLLTVLVVAVGSLVRTPLAYWRGFVREHRYGFSTETRGAWALDRLKGLGIAGMLAAVAMLGLVGLARAFPGWWVVPAAVAAALVVLLMSFVAPVVLEPVFNRFEPLPDRELAADLQGLAERVGVPIREVLVADASRRTTKVNAYVSGLGRTRRLVLFDTLLERERPRGLRLIVAHELGHRRYGHIVKATMLAIGGAVLGVVLIWAVLGTDVADPAVVPRVMLVVTLLEVVALPFEALLSRHWERQADRFSLEATDDLEAFVDVHRDLALANLADLDPPRAVYAVLFSHPTPPERIAAATAWAAG